jgi:hypothetical protein
MEFLAKFLLILLVMSFGAVVTQDLWGWFIVPLGVVPLGYAHAFGINVLVSRFTPQPRKLDDRPYGERIPQVIMALLLYWGIGALLHWCMS